MARIILIDDRIGDAAERLIAATTPGDVVVRVPASASLATLLPQARFAWRSRYEHPSRGLFIAAFGPPGVLLLGRECLSARTANLLVPLRGFAGGHVMLWGRNVAAWRPSERVVEAGTDELPPKVETGPPADPDFHCLHAIAKTLGLPAVAGFNTLWPQTGWHISGRHAVVQPDGAFASRDSAT